VIKKRVVPKKKIQKPQYQVVLERYSDQEKRLAFRKKDIFIKQVVAEPCMETVRVLRRRVSPDPSTIPRAEETGVDVDVSDGAASLLVSQGLATTRSTTAEVQAETIPDRGTESTETNVNPPKSSPRPVLPGELPSLGVQPAQQQKNKKQEKKQRPQTAQNIREKKTYQKSRALRKLLVQTTQDHRRVRQLRLEQERKNSRWSVRVSAPVTQPFQQTVGVTIPLHMTLMPRSTLDL
jgi:hypothetical protein